MEVTFEKAVSSALYLHERSAAKLKELHRVGHHQHIAEVRHYEN
jgi:hypothetical protein